MNRTGEQATLKELAVCTSGHLFSTLGSLLKRTLLQSKSYSGKSEVTLIKAKLLKVKPFLTQFPFTKTNIQNLLTVQTVAMMYYSHPSGKSTSPRALFFGLKNTG